MLHMQVRKRWDGGRIPHSSQFSLESSHSIQSAVGGSPVRG